ncbi:MAG TPA: DUF2844 domain-containing protein [Terriglobales bacterium]
MKATGVVRVRMHGRTLLPLLLAVCAMSLPAMAGLGGDLNSVQGDAAHMKAAVKIEQREAYAVHTIATKNNTTVVREYVSPDGHVFGVAWGGPFMPNLSKVLGTYLQQFTTAMQEDHAKHPGRHPVSISQPGLVVQSMGKVRGYYGRAYVPEMLPQGVQPEEVR